MVCIDQACDGLYDTEFMSMNSDEPLNSRRLDSLTVNDNDEGICWAFVRVPCTASCDRYRDYGTSVH